MKPLKWAGSKQSFLKKLGYTLNIDIEAIEKTLNGEPFAIYILTGKSVPTLEICTMREWNEEDALYLDDEGGVVDDEDFRIAPQFFNTSSLKEALEKYQDYIISMNLEYLLDQ